jgi:hypothetical protein
MRIQREADLMLRRAHAAIGYAELEIYHATTDEAKAVANAKLSAARRALAEAYVVATCHVRHFTLTPYLAGKGPRFRLTGTPYDWEFIMLPVEGPSILLAQGDEYPSCQGHVMPYDEPKTIGTLLYFIVAHHPASGSGISVIASDEEREASHFWVSQAALDLAAPHLDVLEMEARDLEDEHEPEYDDGYGDDDAEGE